MVPEDDVYFAVGYFVEACLVKRFGGHPVILEIRSADGALDISNGTGGEGLDIVGECVCAAVLGEVEGVGLAHEDDGFVLDGSDDIVDAENILVFIAGSQ